jgi:hypothetical protein
LVTRRGALGLLAALPAVATPAFAREYATETELLATIDTLSAEVAARLDALARAVPRARAFVASATADLARHRRERGGAGKPVPPASLEQATSLPRLRTALESLMHAHAEGLPVLADGAHVQRLAGHLIDLSRLLTVVDLWMEGEGLGE